MWHSLNRHHLHQNFLSILQSLEERLICCLQILIVLSTKWHLLDLLLRVDKGDDSAARAQNQLTLVLEHNLYNLVCVSQKNRLLGPLPLLDVDKVLALAAPCRCILLGEGEL